jgi:hypothetical protein
MALIDAEVRDHFATAIDGPGHAIARALRRNQQEVLLSMQRLGCPRLADGPVRAATRNHATRNHRTGDQPMTTPAALAPELAQRLEALKRANQIRSDRAKLKQDLTAGRARIADVLQNPPACVRTAKVNELLLVLPKFGRVRVSKALTQARIVGTSRSRISTRGSAPRSLAPSTAKRRANRQGCRSTGNRVDDEDSRSR